MTPFFDHGPRAPNGQNGNPGGPRGASYFFGFLITFVILLIVFIGCAFTSRRRSAARRRENILQGLDRWGDGLKQREPTYLEPIITKGGDHWGSMMPLSVSIQRRRAGRTEERQSNSSVPDTNTSHAFAFPSWVPGVKESRVHDQEKLPEESEQTLQVAVMVAMPSSARPSQSFSEKEGSLEVREEYQIGVAYVPLRKG